MARALLLGALAAVTITAAAPAQQPVDSTRPPSPTMDGRLRTEIALLSRLLVSVDVPDADSFVIGDREVTAGSTHPGDIALARGELAVRGRVQGDVVVLHGDIVIHPGGVISGNATSVDGRVRTAGGVVEGDIRTIRGITGGILARAAGRASESTPPTTWGSVKMVLGWFAILCAMGIGVMLFAERNLDGVVAALEQNFSRSFWMGVLTQLAAIPALLLLLLGLAISLIGILLIPFAAVAYVMALAGLVTLGFLAVARFTGRAFFRGASPTRTVNLRSMLLGVAVYVGLWFLAALFIWSPVAGAILRGVALAGCWVALTLGLGATMLTRAGTRREGETGHRVQPASDLAWQTPTPVTGVVAARRPVVAVKGK
jgi:hypothetical protein